MIRAVTILAFLLTLTGCGDQAVNAAFAAFEACQPKILAATSIDEVDCVEPQRPTKYIDAAGMLEYWQRQAKTRWALVRGSVEGDLATLRLIDADTKEAETPRSVAGVSVEMVQQGESWLARRNMVSIVDTGSADTSGTGTLQMRTPKRVDSNHVTVSVVGVGDTVAYSLQDRWGEVSVVLQTKSGPLSSGEIQYNYVREAFTEPPLDATISLGVYDEDQYSYKHGGTINVEEGAGNTLSGSFDLWAEQRDGDRVEVAGTFEGMAANGPNLFGG